MARNASKNKSAIDYESIQSSMAGLVVSGYFRTEITKKAIPAPTCITNLIKHFYFSFYYYIQRDLSDKEQSNEITLSPYIPMIFKLPEHPRIDVINIGRDAEANQLILDSCRMIHFGNNQYPNNAMVSRRVKSLHERYITKV